jgi:hypothetical protein
VAAALEVPVVCLEKFWAAEDKNKNRKTSGAFANVKALFLQ